MFEDRELKILLGNSLPEPEVDYDDEQVESEYGHPVEEEALKEYYFVNVTDYINKPDFKVNYLAVRKFINNYDTTKQQMLAEVIMKEIEEEYEFMPSRTVDTNDETEITTVLKFLEFIEYDHEDFIVGVWSFLNPETNSFQVENYCEQNKQKIIDEIEEQLSSLDFPWLIADFLRTYNKENIIEWFCEKSKNLRASILLKLIKE